MYSEVIYLRSEEERNKFDQKLSRLINNKAIKGYDDDICYGYAGQPDRFMFQDFKKLLKECYDNKSSLVWW